MMNKFSQAVIEKIGFYVYLLKDPRTDTIFYIGKGTGNRVFNHLNRALDADTVNDKYDKIREIQNAGYEVQHFILRHGLLESVAFEIESACIELLKLEFLTNEILGQNNWTRGLKTIGEMIQYYESPPAVIDEPSIIININFQFRRDMTEAELYEATRKSWKVGVRRNEAKYAIASYRGYVREVFVIQGWNKCLDERWEFYGQVADDVIRNKYINHSLENYIRKGNQNPIRYSFKSV